MPRMLTSSDAGPREAGVRQRGPHATSPALALDLVRAIAVGVAFAAATAATVGLVADQTYLEGLAVEAALRGGDLVTLIVVAPGLLLSAALAGRGVVRARPVLYGLLLYVVYAYAYHVFTASFGPLFLLHVAIFVGAGVALALGLLSADTGHWIAARADRAVGMWLGFVAAALLWSLGSAALRFALGGELPSDVLPYPEWRVHLGYALDLSVTVPAAAMGAVGLLRHARWGLTFGVTVCVWLAAYQLNYLASHLFMFEAGVGGVGASDPTPYVTAVVFLIPALVLLRGRTEPSDENVENRPEAPARG